MANNSERHKQLYTQKYIDIFKIRVVTFVTALVMLLLVLRVPSEHQNVIYYTLVAIAGYYTYRFWNYKDTSEVFSKLKIPLKLSKPFDNINTYLLTPVITVIVFIILAEQVATDKSLVNPTDMRLGYLNALLVVILFKIAFKVLEAKIMYTFIRSETSLKMTKGIKQLVNLKEQKTKGKYNKDKAVKSSRKTTKAVTKSKPKAKPKAKSKATETKRKK